jgi:D-3-phosphoglycerate dehydrogenase / 2-oxoglutarate reductase
MNGKILVTDSLFIFDEHIQELADAGYEVVRLDKPQATEEELCQAVQGKVGYILGGIERVTDKVIEAADQLKAIAFTGADWQVFIPGNKLATEKGIKIANAPGANSFAVAEFALSVALSMQRNLFELSRTGDKKFQTTGSFKDSTIGVIGSGNIGSRIIKFVQALEPAKVMYHSRTKKDGVEADFVELDELVKSSDIIFAAIPKTAGKLLSTSQFDQMKPGCLIVSVSETLDYEAALPYLQQGKIRAAIDLPNPGTEFDELPTSLWFNTNEPTAYNTRQANQTGSDMAVESLLNMLADKKDKYQVN